MGELDRSAFQPYVDILLARGVVAGVIGPREADRIWERHILNSLALVDLVPVGATVVDVGSGAGLPGIPLAIARPDLSVTLLEPLLRRTTFLEPVVRELGLDERVRVVRARAEDHHERYDVVTARALAPLDRLIRWCRPLLRDGGTLLALKGRSAEDEVHDARDTLRATRLSAHVLEIPACSGAEPARVVRVS